MRPIVLLSAAVLIAACGSDDGELSVEEYRDRANELCADANREVKEIDVPRSADELADFLERLLDLQRKLERQYRELEPPERFEDLHQEALRLTEKADRAFVRIIDRVRRTGDPRELRRGLERFLPEIRRGEEINKELGLDECLEAPNIGEPAPGPA